MEEQDETKRKKQKITGKEAAMIGCGTRERIERWVLIFADILRIENARQPHATLHSVYFVECARPC